MRGTQKISLDYLIALHKDALEKYAEECPSEKASFDNREIKKNQFYKGISKHINRSYKDLSWFSRFENGIERGKECLAQYWIFQDFSQPILKQIHRYTYGLELDEDRIKSINRGIKESTVTGVTNDLFYDLEFNQRDIEINCISPDLAWLTHHIDKIINAARNNNAKFKYITVTPVASAQLSSIAGKLREFNNSNIEIRHAADLDELSTMDIAKMDKIIFPLHKDIILYKNISKKIQAEKGIGEEVLVSGTDIFEKKFTRRKNDFFVQDELKISYTRTWFNAIWNALES